MPPKDIQPTGPLMISTDGGETMEPLGKVTEVPGLSGICIHGEDGYEQFGDLRHAEITFTATVKNKYSVIWFLTEDKRLIPNNWLKMHGIPMERNAWRRRRNGHRSR